MISSYHCSESSPSRWSHISCHQGSYLRSQPRTQVTHVHSVGRGSPTWWAGCHCWWCSYCTLGVWKPDRRWHSIRIPHYELVKKSWGSVERHSPVQLSSPGWPRYWKSDHALQGSHGGTFYRIEHGYACFYWSGYKLKVDKMLHGDLDVYLTLQWAAVTTQFSLIREPPQKWNPV